MQVAAWVFGGLLLVFIMAVVAYRLLQQYPKPIDPTTQSLLGFLSATLSGLFAFFFTGSIAVTVAPTAGKWGTLGIQAGGGMGLFVLVLWWWKSENAPIKAKDLETLEALVQVLGVIDLIYPQLRNIIHPTASPSKPYGVMAKKQDDVIAFVPVGQSTPLSVIAADQLNQLAPSSRAYIKSHEKSMRKLASEWNDLYPKRLAGTNDQQRVTGDRLKLLSSEVCKDLDGIIDHLGALGYDLQDHYGAARSICRELDDTSARA